MTVLKSYKSLKLEYLEDGKYYKYIVSKDNNILRIFEWSDTRAYSKARDFYDELLQDEKR